MFATVVTYSAAISACSTATSWQVALHLFSELLHKQLQLPKAACYDGASICGAPNSVAFNAAVVACEKGSAWESALYFMREMDLRSLELDLITCNAVVNSCSCSCRWGYYSAYSSFWVKKCFNSPLTRCLWSFWMFLDI